MAVSVLALILVTAFPHGAICQEQSEDIETHWDEVGTLRSRGEFDQAIEILNEMLAQYPENGEIARRAYNELVFTLDEKDDVVRTVEVARNALTRFPDLEAPRRDFPPRINEIYEQLRPKMFGSLTVSQSDGAMLQLNGEIVGPTPYHAEYVLAGEYSLLLEKEGFEDHSEVISIEAGRDLYRDIDMVEQKGRSRWWLWTGAVAVAAVLGVLLIPGGDEETPPAEPLPGPPDPPSR